MKIIERCFAKKWLTDNKINFSQRVEYLPVVDDVSKIERNNGLISFSMKSLEDFVFACIVKFRVPYSKFPDKFKNDYNFVSNICTAMPKILNEILISNPSLFERIVANNKTLIRSVFVDKDVKKAIRKCAKTTHKQVRTLS